MQRALVLIAVAACSGGGADAVRPPPHDLELGTHAHATHATPDAAAARATAPVADAAVAVAPADAVPAAAPAGHDFIAEARLLYRLAACGPAPEGAPVADDPRIARVVDRHCKNLRARIAKFRAAYLERHRGWFERVVPDDIPRTVVYPFGGGDLLSALVAFPDATEITTISLELAGDPRRITTLSPGVLDGSLAALRVEIGGLLSVGSNTSVNLSAQQRNELPGQVVSFLIALVTAGYEPVSLRYFTLDDDGAIHYLDDAAIEAAERAQPRKGDWVSPNFSEAFSHVELRYRRPGEPTVRVHRHLGWNLSDAYLARHPAVLRHLEAKGKVTVLVKGASYLLQRPQFSRVRDYLLDHLAWMLSDSTGIPPTYARPAGMIQETYGSYHGAFLEGSRANRHDDAFVELWRRQPRRALSFRFGYVDAAGAAHLVVTRPR